jgi:hypothetical protein
LSKNRYSKIEKIKRSIKKSLYQKKNEIDGLIKDEDGLDLIKTKALIEVLDSHHKALEKEDSSIYDLLLNNENTTDNEVDEELNSQMEHSTAYHLIKKEVEQILSRSSVAGNTSCIII